MATLVTLANAAAVHLGKDPLFTDPAKIASRNSTGQALMATWPIVLEASLRRHYWGFARGRQRVAVAEMVPEFGWSTAYELPTDCVRAWDVNFQPGVKRTPFAREGDYLLANTTGPIDLRFIKRILDPTKFDGEFADYMAKAWAQYNALKVTGSASLSERLLDDMKGVLVAARSIDAQEGDEEIDDDQGDLLEYRGRFA